ncbi:EamA family transporter RarD, partial [Streptomyces violascens]|uniref:EamA family transporter RarD n=1 Tax=Streptomyces violascens TaxID=67381 RepID=UPI0036C05A3B
MWGLVPLFWPLLKPADAIEILAHRMVWSLALVVVVLLVMRRWAWIGELVRQPRRLGLIAVAAVVITVNWGIYIWSVNSGHVVEASLGYFINPLVTIAMGVLILKERLRRPQWIAVGIGAAAVVVLTVGYGRPPWISLTLAFSFATYGLVKKKVNLGGLESRGPPTPRAVRPPPPHTRGGVMPGPAPRAGAGPPDPRPLARLLPPIPPGPPPLPPRRPGRGGGARAGPLRPSRR